MAASEPKLLFIGVTTEQSKVNLLFPAWQRCLNENLQLDCRNIPLRSEPKDYIEVICEIRESPTVINGALITSHKAAVFQHASQVFDRVTSTANMLREIGMVYWRNGELVGDANDPLATAMTCEHILNECESWYSNSREAIILGGGGAGVALAHTLLSHRQFECSHITIAESEHARVVELRAIISQWDAAVPIDIYHLADSTELVSSSQPSSLIANATGLGKDAPGSPVRESVSFPVNSIVWDFNYRFIDQDEPTIYELAISQRERAGLHVEHGWRYFIWGWLVMMASACGKDVKAHFPCFLKAAGEFDIN